MKIGLETHVQLNTKTKLFCSCEIGDNYEPNSKTCPTCLGLPGGRPRVNREAVSMAIKTSLALNCEISEELIFSRKSYFYPDLPRNFQITQHEMPIGRNGFINVGGDKIRISEIHLEEDPAKIIYPDSIEKSLYTLLDYNRSGIPLVEIVTETDFKSIENVKKYLAKLRLILSYIDVSKGEIKSDANISVGSGSRIEIKNIVGEKNITDALEYEFWLQKNTPSAQSVTKGWNPEKSVTFLMRTKETMEDYGYIIETDIPVIPLEKIFISDIRKQLPEMPYDRIERLKKEYGLGSEEAETIISEKEIADLFEYLLKELDSTFISKWIKTELKRELNYRNARLKDLSVSADDILSILKKTYKKDMTPSMARKILRQLIEKGKVKMQYKSVSEDEIIEAAKSVMQKEASAVKKYKEGKLTVLNFLIGQIDTILDHRASHERLRKALKELLDK